MSWQSGASRRGGVLLVLVLLAGAAAAQVEPIPELPMTLDGQVSAGFAGGSGSGSGFSNGGFFGTTANLNGYYHDPRFLKFSVLPAFRWNSNSDGIEAGTHDNDESLFSRVDFLSGSSMPLGFQYSFQRTNFSTLSSGLAPITLASTGISQNFGINWAINKRHYPTLGVNYSWGSSSADYTGLNASGSSSNHSAISLNSNYSLLGFQLGGAFSYSQSEEHTPDLLNLGLPTVGTTDMTTENFTLQRALPLKSQLSAQFSHTDDNYNLFGSPQSQGFNLATGSLVSAPIPRLTLSAGVNYDSNTSAQILSQLVSGTPGTGTGTGTGAGTAAQVIFGTGRALGFNENATYDVGHGFYLLGSALQQTSEVSSSENLITDQYLAGVSYSHRLFGGILGLSYMPGYETVRIEIPGAVTSASTARAMTHSGSATYSRRIGRWQGQGNFNYNQSNLSQTMIIPILSRSVSGAVQASTRFWHRWNFSFNAMVNDGKVPGLNGNRSELFGAQLSNRTWSFSAQEQVNSGYSVLTAAGITSIGLPGATLLPNTAFTDSSGQAFSVSYRRRYLTVVSTFTNASATLHAVTNPTQTGNKYFESRVTYRFRKVDLQGGYRWYSQMASTNVLLNQSFQTYWIAVVRQFHLF